MTLTPHAPVVETENLILRGYREEDFEAFAGFCTSDRARYVGGPQDRWGCWRSFMAGIGHWTLRGYGMWMIEHRATGQVAGRVGMIYNDGWDEPELGWHIYNGFEGKGYAYEATLAARAFSARHFSLDAAISYIDPDNIRSIRLARRLEARFERDGTVVGHPCQVWRHPSEGDL